MHPGRPREAYSDLLYAFGYFNETAFLTGCLSAPAADAGPASPRMLGAFAPNRFESRTGESAHEIILNPHYLAQREDFESLSTLVHEMAHQWREELGPGRGRRRTKGARGVITISSGPSAWNGSGPDCRPTPAAPGGKRHRPPGPLTTSIEGWGRLSARRTS